MKWLIYYQSLIKFMFKEEVNQYFKLGEELKLYKKKRKEKDIKVK